MASTTRRISVGPRRLAYRRQLLHQSVVDLEPARSVDDDNVSSGVCGLFESALGQFWSLAFPVDEDGDTHTASEGLELIYRGRSLQICCHQERFLGFLAEQVGQFGGCGGLARALQSNHEDDQRRRDLCQFSRLCSKCHHQLFVDDLDDLLTRVIDLDTDSSRARSLNPGKECFHHSDIDVCFEEGETYLAQGRVDVLLGELPFAAQAREDRLEPLGQRVEHCSGRLFRMSLQLDTVFVWVNEVEASLGFYEALGIQAGARFGAWQNMAVEGPTRFALHEGERPPGGSTSVPSFLVGDLDAEIARLADRGIHPTDEAITDTGVARFTTFTDPDGNELQLIER